ncbi:Phosphoglucosamine mutase [Methylobacterium organophilum]|uniref:Phosphoglucosamine mutase n=1 Tax=Methylobacterium organophilum TaxID=410 RepID=A0ABQ4T586_METOR|nr:Phosphoglucosamine mutase [Methylobacterium organophilum]
MRSPSICHASIPALQNFAVKGHRGAHASGIENVRKYFGTDGVRGRANGVITPELALKVGQAAGVIFQRGDHRHRVVIGKDTRLSGYMIETALVAGFTSVGMDVLLLGPMPTPAVAMLTRSMRADLGVMISASHNPFEDNGIKLFGPDGFKLSDEVELEIEALIDGDMRKSLAGAQDLGRAKRIESVHARYIEFAKRTLPRHVTLEGLRVVVDCANGAAYRVAPETLWELGAEVISIGVEPDGFNINRDVGSTAPNALINKVRELRADVGIALDGDADRVLIVDEKGQKVDGDQLMAVVARSWKEDERLTQPGLVATIMSNLGLERYLGGLGLTLARTAVGDRYVLEHMREHGYNLGGEQSGHIIMSDYATTGDGLVAALQLLSVVKRLERPVSEVCHCFDPLPQILKNVRFRSGEPLRADSVVTAIAQAKQRLGNGGRLVIRPSGTEPVIRVMAEGDDHDLVAEVVDEVVDAVARAAA